MGRIGGSWGVLFLLFCQCSSNNTTTGSANPDAGVSADLACTDLAKATCEKRQSCTNLVQASGAQVLTLFGNAATCLEREKLACLGSVRAPRSGFTPAGVERCVAAHTQWSCADFLDNVPPPDCMPEGSGENGAACAFNAQCKSGYCVGSKQKLCGACGESPPAGASCAESFCGHNQLCVSGLCQPRGSLGAPCDNTTAPCQAGMSCTGATGATKTCQSSLTNMTDTCGGANPGCYFAQGLWCLSSSRTCTHINYVGAGQPCGTPPDGTHAECQTGNCYTSTGLAAATDLGSCVTNAGDGVACDTALGPACIMPARCVTTQDGGTRGTCTIPDGVTCD